MLPVSCPHCVQCGSVCGCADAVQGPTAYWDGLLQNLPEAQRQSVLGAHAEGGIFSQNVDDDDEFDLDDD